MANNHTIPCEQVFSSGGKEKLSWRFDRESMKRSTDVLQEIKPPFLAPVNTFTAVFGVIWGIFVELLEELDIKELQ